MSTGCRDKCSTQLYKHSNISQLFYSDYATSSGTFAITICSIAILMYL